MNSRVKSNQFQDAGKNSRTGSSRARLKVNKDEGKGGERGNDDAVKGTTRREIQIKERRKGGNRQIERKGRKIGNRLRGTEKGIGKKIEIEK